MPSAPARSAAALLGLCCACPALALAAPAWPPAQLVNLSLAYAAREIAHLRGGTLRGSAVRDLAAAAWVTLALGNASSPSGAPPASAVADARDALDAVFAAQLGDGRFPWAFGDATCLDNNSVQFTSLPVLLAVIRFGGALGAPALARWRPHLAGAAVASFAEGSTPAGEAQPFYTNIYSMRLANLLLFGDVLGNATVAAQGLAALSTWEALLSGAGVHEYVSPTYTAVALHNLYAGAAAARDGSVAARLRRLADALQTAAAAVFFAPAFSMAGGHSRDYDFVTGAAGMDWDYVLSGIAAPDSVVADADPITEAELLALAVRGELPPAPPLALALAAPPTSAGAWRVVKSSFLPSAGQASATQGADWTLYVGTAAALGTSSLFYGPQDKMVAASLARARGAAPSSRVPQVTLVQDAFDSPYANVKRPDGSGHEKPTHLKATVAAVQDGALALVLNDLTMAIEGSSRGGPFTSIAANVVFPAGAGVDGVYVDGARVANASAGAPDVPLPLGATVAVRSAGGVVAFRVPFADGLNGFVPRAALKFDGPPGSGAARLATYLYAGPNATFPDDPPPSRSLLVVGAGEADDDAGAAAFSALLAGLVVTNDAANASDWRVRVEPPPAAPRAGQSAPPPPPPGFASTLDAALCVPRTKTILARRVNGTDVAIPPGGTLAVEYSNGTRVSVTL